MTFISTKETMSEIFKIGIPTLVSQLLPSVSISLTNNAAGRYGDSAIAGMGVVTRIISMAACPYSGLSKAFSLLQATSLWILYSVFFSLPCFGKRQRELSSWGLPTGNLLYPPYPASADSLGTKWNHVCILVNCLICSAFHTSDYCQIYCFAG